RLGGAVVDVTLGEKQCFRGLAERRAQRSRLHEAGFRAVVSWCGRGHVLLHGRMRYRPKTKTRPGGKSSAGHTCPRPFSNLFYVACKPAGSNDHGITAV